MTEDNKYNSEDNQDNTYEDSQPELYEHHRIVVDKGQGLIRIDKYLTNLLGGVSRTRFQNAADFGFITVNGETVKSSYRVKPLDEIVISLETPPSDYTIVPQDIPLSVVFEDDDIMVVNKTPDMVVHPGVGNLDGTLLNAIAWYLRDNPKFDVNNPRVGLVHRIDKDTSGLLLIAKNEQAKSFLGKQFQDKTTKRTYNALVWGIVKDDTGTVDGALARNPKDRMQFCVFDPDENPLADKGGGSSPTPAEVRQYADGLVDPTQIAYDNSYVYRGLDESQVTNKDNPYPTHLGTSPRFHGK